MSRRHDIWITADVPGIDEKLRALIRKSIRMVLTVEGLTLPCEIDVRVTHDAGIQEINRTYRKVDRPTDVLSFPALELSPGQLPDQTDADLGSGRIPLGDIAISIERVQAQAKEYGHSNRRELSYLVVHAMLHLLGYDHMDEGAEKARMRAREELILDKLGIKA